MGGEGKGREEGERMLTYYIGVGELINPVRWDVVVGGVACSYVFQSRVLPSTSIPGLMFHEISSVRLNISNTDPLIVQVFNPFTLVGPMTVIVSPGVRVNALLGALLGAKGARPVSSAQLATYVGVGIDVGSALAAPLLNTARILALLALLPQPV